jgi:hypothetical protein
MKERERGASGSDTPATIMTVTSSTIASLRGRAGRLWLDSGATHHVVNDVCLLRNPRSPSVSQAVLGGGEEHAVLSQGDILLKGGPAGSVLLTNVLLVPTLGSNLVSTSQITSKNGSCWEGRHSAHIYDPKGRVILRGHKVDGMYHLDCTLAASPGANVNFTSDSAQLWHRRFGHIHHATLKKMIRVGAVTGIDRVKINQEHSRCDVCAQAKLTRVV